MKIAVLSGKGGTGKTFISVNLAAAAGKAVYIDCDVEEPNGHLFFKPAGLAMEEVSVMVPQVQEELCRGCRKCVDFCKFNALAFINDQAFSIQRYLPFLRRLYFPLSGTGPFRRGKNNWAYSNGNFGKCKGHYGKLKYRRSLGGFHCSKAGGENS